ncbi:SEC-C domain-containing protein [Candidatus Gottesmanbacteria bacterium]|nr:SEC-C domain-containing protein [Candidatus Gottesmanbacteria bacterium]
MFERLIAAIDSDIVHRIFKVQVQLAPSGPNPTNPTNTTNPTNQNLQPSITQAVRRMQTNTPKTSVAQPIVTKKLGRNDPCPCGSGKKWKKCHYPNIP